MNIGFYRYSIYNRGGDRLIVAYANYLAEAGHDVTMYVRHVSTSFPLGSKLRMLLVPSPGKVGFLLYAATHRFKHDIIITDIIHLPLVLSFHNKVLYYAQADDRQYYSNKFLRNVINMLYAMQFRSGRPVISMSQHLTDIFARDYGVHDSHTIKTGIDHTVFHPEPDKDLLSQKGRKRAIVFMSRGDTYRKGHDIAIQVFKSLDKHTASSMELWVCGNRLDESPYPFTTRNFGALSDSRLRQVLSSADIFFYPSRHEGFGLFPLEAMACGCVVITTDAIPYARQTISIMTSPIGDAEDLKNNLLKLLNSNAVFQDLKKNTFRESWEYDLNKSKIAFENALQMIVTSGRSRT